jgi:hypothetical protein
MYPFHDYSGQTKRPPRFQGGREEFSCSEPRYVSRSLASRAGLGKGKKRKKAAAQARGGYGHGDFACGDTPGGAGLAHCFSFSIRRRRVQNRRSVS